MQLYTLATIFYVWLTDRKVLSLENDSIIIIIISSVFHCLPVSFTLTGVWICGFVSFFSYILLRRKDWKWKEGKEKASCLVCIFSRFHSPCYKLKCGYEIGRVKVKRSFFIRWMHFLTSVHCNLFLVEFIFTWLHVALLSHGYVQLKTTRILIYEI